MPRLTRSKTYRYYYRVTNQHSDITNCWLQHEGNPDSSDEKYRSVSLKMNLTLLINLNPKMHFTLQPSNSIYPRHVPKTTW